MATPPRRPTSGASRSNTSKTKPAKRPQGATRRTASAPPKRRMPRGRLVVFALLAGLLAYGVWWLGHRPSVTIEGVPAALSSLDAAEPETAPVSTKKPAERFEFYDILPNQRVLPSRTPEARSTARPPSPPQQPSPNASASTTERWLQVGAFRQEAPADQRMAQLRSLGIAVQRQRGFDAQGKPLTRIVAGPFTSALALSEARTRLANAGLDAIPLSSLGDSQ